MKKLYLLILALGVFVHSSPTIAAEAFNSYTNTSCQSNDELAGYRSGTGMRNYTCTSLADSVFGFKTGSDITHNKILLAADSNQIVFDSDGTFTATFTNSALSANRTYTFPNTSGSVVLAGGTNTLSQKTFDNTNKWGFSVTAASGNSFTVMKAAYINSSGQAVLTDADAEASSAGMIVISNGTVAATASGTFVPHGFISTTGLTAGATYYLSQTAGEITTTPPTYPGTVKRIVGYAVSTSIFYVDPDQTYGVN